MNLTDSIEKMNERIRYKLIDAARGLAVINMVIYHFLYDINVIFGGNRAWYRNFAVSSWEICICSAFIIISGISWNLSHHRIRSGIILNICGGAVTLATVIFIPSESIWFGILSFLGCAVLIMTFTDMLFKKCLHIVKKIMSGGEEGTEVISAEKSMLFSVFMTALNILLFLLTYKSIYYGYVGLFGMKLFDLPDFLKENIYLVIFGFGCSKFMSSDYFPLMPYFFLYAAGKFIWDIISKNKTFLNILKSDIPILSAIGRKSLLIYMLHQPLCFGAAWLICHR